MLCCRHDHPVAASPVGSITTWNRRGSDIRGYLIRRGSDIRGSKSFFTDSTRYVCSNSWVTSCSGIRGGYDIIGGLGPLISKP